MSLKLVPILNANLTRLSFKKIFERIIHFLKFVLKILFCRKLIGLLAESKVIYGSTIPS